MKKFFILAVVLCVASASAMTAVAVKTPYTPPTNAYWQIIDDGGDNVLACVLEGQDVYGDGDDCRIYNTDTLDFTTVIGELYLEFDISLANDGIGDHCLLQMRDAGDSSWTTFEDFDADTAGYEPRSYDLVGGAWGDWTVYDSVYMRFRWVSDDDGTSDGARVNNVLIYETGNAGIVEDFEEYSVGDGMDDIGWTEDFTGGGHWLIDDTFAYSLPRPGSGNFMSCDDDAIDTTYDTTAWSPEISDVQDTDLTVDFSYACYLMGQDTGEFWIDVNGSPTMIASYPTYTSGAFDVSYDLSSYLSVGDDFELGWYYASPYGWTYWFGVDDILLDIPVENDLFFDDFEGDLGLWTVVDQGSSNINIEEKSLGTIKSMFH